jgi:2'-5' RNA ligase
VDGSERLRLFCALRLPEASLDRISSWAAGGLRGGRVVARENLHITLAFLGSQAAESVPAIAGALGDAAAGARGLRLSLRGYRETRSVGMLTFDDEGERAVAMAGRLHESLEALGLYEREARAWLPHVTVLRFRERPRLQPSLPELGVVVPSDAAVYISRLRPGGAVYEALEVVALGG